MALSRPPIQTFAILDLQTTGFSNPRKITELCCIAVARTETFDYTYYQNKLNLCFNPRKQLEAEAEKVSGWPTLRLSYRFNSVSVTLDFRLALIVHLKKIYFKHNNIIMK